MQVFDRLAISGVALGAVFLWNLLEWRRLHRALQHLCGQLVDLLPTFILGRWVFGTSIVEHWILGRWVF